MLFYYYGILNHQFLHAIVLECKTGDFLKYPC
jgi:hypothetical protein